MQDCCGTFWVWFIIEWSIILFYSWCCDRRTRPGPGHIARRSPVPIVFGFDHSELYRSSDVLGSARIRQGILAPVEESVHYSFRHFGPRHRRLLQCFRNRRRMVQIACYIHYSNYLITTTTEAATQLLHRQNSNIYSVVNYILVSSKTVFKRKKKRQ